LSTSLSLLIVPFLTLLVDSLDKVAKAKAKDLIEDLRLQTIADVA
jgi:hypothetical protein